MSIKKRWTIFEITMNRRIFLQTVAGSTGVLALHPLTVLSKPAARSEADAKIQKLIDAHRPSRLKKLPHDFDGRVGASHVAGRYHLTNKPFLIEGAEKLLELGTRLGKFFVAPKSEAGYYPFNSHWEQFATLVDVVHSAYFRQLFSLPFSTIILEASSPLDWPTAGGKAANLPDSSAKAIATELTWPAADDRTANWLRAVSQAYFDLAAHLYKVLRDRKVTVIIQHWEGDWLLRGRGGERWDPPPPDWKQRCDAMVQWLNARQQGVSRARREFGRHAKCRVVHAAEVNRVADLWKGIPTVTEHVLPHVELDLVSYSCYDGMKNGVTLWKCIAEIKKHVRTTGLFGKNSVYVGEIGIPENLQPERVTERWDELFGTMLAAKVPYIAMWELYCNELNGKIHPPPPLPVKKFNDVLGFWLVRPDSSLSETGKFFTSLWKRSADR